jgi:hypothetical protein
MNERPAIAAVAIGHRDDPATLPPQSAIAFAAIPETPSDAAPADSGEAPSPAVAPEAKSLMRSAAIKFAVLLPWRLSVS